jgi:Helicase associated domain
MNHGRVPFHGGETRGIQTRAIFPTMDNTEPYSVCGLEVLLKQQTSWSTMTTGPYRISGATTKTTTALLLVLLLFRTLRRPLHAHSFSWVAVVVSRPSRGGRLWDHSSVTRLKPLGRPRSSWSAVPLPETNQDRDHDHRHRRASAQGKVSVYDAKWNVMFEKLKVYKTIHGDCLVPSRYKCDDGTTLGTWVINQRRARRYISEDGKRHDEWRRQALDSIGFVWIVNERMRQLTPETGQYASAAERFNARWNARFEQLKEYKKVHGHCQVPQSYECADGTKLGKWVSKQRMDGSSDSEMNVMRRQALDDIGFVWQVREPKYTLDEHWNDMYQQLQEYQAAHGDCLVPTDYVTNDNKRLGSWVRNQRSGLASGRLFKDLYQDRLQKLQSIGFALRALSDDSDDSRWTRLFGQLVEYRRHHGDCLVPIGYPENQDLGYIVKRLRAEGDRMSRDRREQLDAIGFVWDALEAKWYAKFNELLRFQRQHDHCLVTADKHDAEYPGLDQWVSTQRSNRHTLDTKRIQELDAIGFVWDALEASWYDKFHELHRFQQQYSHCLVSRYQHDAEYPGLGIWVNTQRFNRHTMDAERIQQLDSIGFVWDPQETTWNSKLHELQRFQRQHGHRSFPRRQHDHDAEYPGLCAWVSTQRGNCHTMDAERIQLLDSIGFVWDGQDANWNAMFEQLCQYQAMHGHRKVPSSYDDKLARWAYRQREKRTELSPDRQAKLQSIGFFG